MDRSTLNKAELQTNTTSLLLLNLFALVYSVYVSFTSDLLHLSDLLIPFILTGTLPFSSYFYAKSKGGIMPSNAYLIISLMLNISTYELIQHCTSDDALVILLSSLQYYFCIDFILPPLRKYTSCYTLGYGVYLAVRGKTFSEWKVTLVMHVLCTIFFTLKNNAITAQKLIFSLKNSLDEGILKEQIWRKIVQSAPGSLTLIISDKEPLFISSEFMQQFREILLGSHVTLKTIKQVLTKIRSTNSCVEASLWKKIVEYNTSEDDPKVLGEFVYVEEEDEEKATHYSVRIEKIQYRNTPARLLQITDITGTKKAQHEVLGKKYKNILLTTASHELKTPLNGVLGGMQLILQSDNLSSIKGYCAIMECSCRLLLNITEDMLDYCLYESGDLTLNSIEVKLQDIFTEAIKIIEVQTRQRGVELIFNYDPNIPETIRTDPKRLMQILLNLLCNAAKYTFRGAITICAENRDQDVLVKIIDTGIGMDESKKEGLFKLFGRISGDSPRKASKVTAGAGSGLGLTVSQALASLLGTGISFTTTEGEGSEFWFAINKELKKKRSNSVKAVSSAKKRKVFLKRATVFLQSKSKAAVSAAPSSQKLRPIPTLKLKRQNSTGSADDEDDFLAMGLDEGTGLSPKRSIARYTFHSRCALSDISMRLSRKKACDCPNMLIADDNAFNLLVLKSLLEKLRLTCATAVNGEDAVEKTKVFGKCPCENFKGIMMDCDMPVKDGLEASQELVELMGEGEIKEIPIIACTAFTDDERRNKCFESGMKAFMNKPVMIEELRRCLQECRIIV